jgi:hypothetical protein
MQKLKQQNMMRESLLPIGAKKTKLLISLGFSRQQVSYFVSNHTVPKCEEFNDIMKAVSLKGASKLPPSTSVLFVVALAHFKLEQKRKLWISSLRVYTERSFGGELCSSSSTRLACRP